MLVRHLFRMVTALDVARNGLHRAGSVQRNDCGNVLNGLRAQTGNDVGNARAFQLEHAHGRALAEHLVSRGVAHIHVLDGKIRRVTANQLFRVRDNGQVAQAEEVHLEQTEFLDRHHRKLRYHLVAVARQRNVGVHGVLGDNHACRMRRCVARHALERTRRINKLFDLRLLVVHLFQLRVDGQRLVDRNVQLIRHLLGDSIHIVVRDVERTADIADGTAGSHRAERDNLRHAVLAVLAGNVLDDLRTANIAEVHVDIRHGDTLRIQKSLEVQRVVNRVKVSDSEAVRHDRACCRAASGSDRNTLTFRVADKVGHDEEVIDKAHLGDHVDLVLQTLAHGAVVVRIASCEAFIAQLLQIFERGVAVRHIEFGQMVLSKLELDLTAFCDLYRVGECLRVLREQRRHFVRILDVELLCLELHAGRVIHGLAHLDGHEHVLNARICLSQIMRVVRCHQTDVQLPGKLVQTFIDFLLQRNAVVLNFKVEMLPVKNIEELLAEVIRAVHITVRQRTRDSARQTGRQTNQTFAVRAQQLHVDTRLHIEAFRETARHHVDEVAVAGHVLAQQDEVRVPLAVDVAAVKARMRRQIHLAADDRMDPLRLAGAVKVDHAVHDAMVGQRARGLPQLCHTVHQLFDTAGAVQQAVFAVDMQMCKWYQFSPPFPQAR